MKRLFACALALVGSFFHPSVLAEDKQPAADAKAAAKAEESAESMVERLEREIMGSDDLQSFKSKLASAKKDFKAAHPKSDGNLRLEILEAIALVQEEGMKAEPKGTKILQDIENNKDAGATVKARASGFLISILAQTSSEKAGGLGKLREKVVNHLKSYPDFEDNPVFSRMLKGSITESEDSATLQKIIAEDATAHPDWVEVAKGRLDTLKTLAEVKSKPLELSFTAVDGRQVDLSKMRGQVVLLDFWATWCGPCIRELPNVLAAYKELHPKGFEIIGISLDDNKEQLEKMTKQKGMTWPQYFDGKGWENDLAKKYGITGIPAMWLIDKKGMVVSMNAREDLAGEVSKLLKK